MTLRADAVATHSLCLSRAALRAAFMVPLAAFFGRRASVADR